MERIQLKNGRDAGPRLSVNELSPEELDLLVIEYLARGSLKAFCDEFYLNSTSFGDYLNNIGKRKPKGGVKGKKESTMSVGEDIGGIARDTYHRGNDFRQK